MRTRLLLIAALFASAACATERELLVQSNPPGAQVRIDERTVGETPYRFAYDAYGTRRVTLYKEGYRTRSQLVELNAPWYAIFPLDFISELLVPFGWKDKRTLEIELEPEEGRVTMPDLQGVLDRAEVFRRAGPEGPKLETAQPVKPAIEDEP